MRSHTSLLWLGLMGVFACAGPVIKKPSIHARVISRVDLNSLQFFRPDYDVAEVDDFSHQDRKLECVEPRLQFQPLLTDTKAILKCLNGLKVGDLTYRFQKGAQMELRFESTSSTENECVGKLLPIIPLPREIYFLGQEVSNPDASVYSVSFNPKMDSLVDWSFLTPSPKIQVKVPLSRELESKADVEVWLKTLVLSLFLGEQGIHATYVPEFIAKQCFRDDPEFQDKKTGKKPTVFWP